MTNTTEKKPAAKKTAVKKSVTKKAATKKTGSKIKVTQINSSIGRVEKQKGTLRGLGLNKINSSKILEDTDSVRGMINAVKHLVKVETA